MQLKLKLDALSDWLIDLTCVSCKDFEVRVRESDVGLGTVVLVSAAEAVTGAIEEISKQRCLLYKSIVLILL